MMRVCIAVAVLVAVAQCVPVVREGAETMTVTLNVFSGEENPSFKMELPEKTQHSCVSGLRSHYAILGYRGFSIETQVATDVEVMGCIGFERELLAAGVAAGAITPSVALYVQSEIMRLASVDASKAGPNPTSHVNLLTVASMSGDFTPVVGPDTPLTYDPTHDDQGDFETYCNMNNCYNYGSDIVTNTFAQPGRGSGKKWVENTCENMNVSAIADGLVWVGTDLPTAQPASGHYVGLLIWPSTNFHWVRMDVNKEWSHKPGGTPVRNTDNNGQTIVDPSKADLSPWTQFCGYYNVIPSKLTIN